MSHERRSFGGPPFRPVTLPRRMEQFFSKVSPEPMSGCWLWAGAISGGGYGLINAGGEVQTAHRVSYAIEYGQPPNDLVLDHRCRNRACVNPRHLEPVTYGENRVRGFWASGLPVASHFECGHARAGNTQTWDGRCRQCAREWVAVNRPPRVRVLKSHCKRGHPLSGDNLYLTTKGHRACRECGRAHCRDRYRRIGRAAMRPNRLPAPSSTAGGAR